MVVQKIMTPPVPDAVRGQIFALKIQRKSAYVVRKELLVQTITVSERAICALCRKKLLGILPFEGTEPWQKRRRMKTARTPEVVKKVKRLTQTDNPSTQQFVGRRWGVSQPTVSRIVREDLDLKRLKKPAAEHLTDAMVEQRKNGQKHSRRRWVVSFWSTF